MTMSYGSCPVMCVKLSRAGHSSASLPEIAPQQIEVGGVSHIVEVEVRRPIPTRPKVAPEQVEVGGIDYLVRVGIARHLTTQLHIRHTARYGKNACGGQMSWTSHLPVVSA